MLTTAAPSRTRLHQVAVLPEERPPARLLLPLRQPVRADLGAAPLDLAASRPERGSTSRRAHASSAVRPCQPASRALGAAGSAVALTET